MISCRDSFTAPCSKICHHLIRKLLIIRGKILHSTGTRLHLQRPLYLDEGLPPRMNVKNSALSEISESGLKACGDARTIRTALNDVQTALQTSQRHRTLCGDKCVVVV